MSRRHVRRVSRKLHYHVVPQARLRRARVVFRFRRRRIVYVGRWPLAATAILLCAAAIAIGSVVGQVLIALASVVVTAVWIAYAIRVQRPITAGIGGDGPDSPPGAGVREPRRPLPTGPTGRGERTLPVG
jgi:hypothetical protein